jgi:hypothetical protein
MAPSVPVSLLVTKDVPFEWHDAVAIVAQLVAQVREDIPFAQPRIPELRAISLEETGTLSLSTNAQTLPGMPGAAQILQQLLSGRDQPPPLRLYLMQALTADPVPTLGGFADELLKWERPNRQQKLATLYARSVVKAGAIAVTEEPPRVRDEVFLRSPPVETPPPAPPKVKKPKPPPDPDAPNTPMVIGVLVTVAALIIGGAAWYILGRPASAPAEVQAEVSAPTKKLDRKDIALPPTPKPPAPAIDPPPRGRRPAAPLPAALVEDAQAELARARELFQRQEYASANIAFDRVLEMLENTSSPQAEEIRQAATALAEVSRAAIAEQAEAAIQEYRTGDEGVSDPVPLAYLPPRPNPNTPPEGLQVLEVHINTAGTVDSAKFVMNRPTFRNSWWTSAAKAWRFTPATRDGRPVRFVMRIVMDDPISSR